MDDCRVIFSSMEELDELNANRVANAAKNSIVDVLNRFKEDRVMLFPFAFLTSTLSSPRIALRMLQSVKDSLMKARYAVKGAPLGGTRSSTSRVTDIH